MQASFTSKQNSSNNQESPQFFSPNSFADNRSQTVNQAKLIDGINNSPKLVGQRKAQEAIFGNNSTAQLMGTEEELMQGKFENPAQMMTEEEELMQGKFEAPIQRMGEEEELMQGKFSNPPTIQKKASNGLPSDLNANLESTLNTDFSDVNIHTNSNDAVQMNALAYAQGTDVHFAPGQFKPNTSSGQKLIGHEFAHVVQQAEGRVKPTAEVNGMPVNDNKGLEGEADKIGDTISRL